MPMLSLRRKTERNTKQRTRAEFRAGARWLQAENRWLTVAGQPLSEAAPGGPGHRPHDPAPSGLTAVILDGVRSIRSWWCLHAFRLA